MKFLDVHIDGFGSFAGHDVGPFDDGLNIVLGANEAGKSTLLDFIRGVLYGFADRRSPRSFHEPLYGGRHGGSMRISDQHEATWTIERHVGRQAIVLQDSGSQAPDAALNVLLGHTDRRTFESIFAFGLDELAQADRLHEESVRDLIFSAGVAGAGRSASVAIKHLEEERADLTRNARAVEQRSRLLQLASSRDDIVERLRAARNQSGRFEDLLREIDRCNQLERAAYERFRALERRDLELKDLEHAEATRTRRAQLDEQIRLLSPLTPSESRIIESFAEIDDVRIRFANYERNIAELSRLNDEADERAEQARRLRDRIGLTAANTHPVEVPLVVQHEIARIDGAYQEAQVELRALATNRSGAERELVAAEDEVTRCTRDHNPEDLDSATEHLKELPTLRSMLAQLRDLDHSIQLAERIGQPDRGSSVTSMLGVILAMVVIVGVAAMVIGITRAPKGLDATTLLGAAVVLIGIAGFALIVRQRRQTPETARADVNEEDEPRALEHRVAERATRLGLASHPTEAELEELERVLREQEQVATDIRTTLRARERALRQVASIGQEVERWENERQLLEERAAKLSAELGLVRAAQPDGLRDVVTHLDELSAILREEQRTRMRIPEAEALVTTFENNVDSLFERCHLDPPHPKDIGAGIGRLFDEATTLADRVRARAEIEAEIANADRELDAVVRRYDDPERGRTELEEGFTAERELELAELKGAREDARNEHLAIVEERRDFQHDLDALKDSASIAELEVQLSSVNAEIASILQRWAMLSLSSTFLKNTLSRYEVERQPEVIARAADLFCEITAGRYVKVFSHEDDQQRRSLRVIRHDGASVEAQYLSKGTAEQLYLCVRLAYATTFAERSVSLPLIFDDVLVNFDPVRSVEVARAIASVAKDHQVLVFTCHPSVVATFEAVAVSPRVVTLG